MLMMTFLFMFMSQMLMMMIQGFGSWDSSGVFFEYACVQKIQAVYVYVYVKMIYPVYLYVLRIQTVYVYVFA